jgi:uncharacterized protein (TIGR02058 family)
MTAKRFFLEIGSGNDLHGGDYTKAAVRAVQDAMHHSSLGLFRSLGIDPNSMQVEVTIGVQRPEKVDPVPVAAAFPYGKVSVKAVAGGLDVPDEEGREPTIIASAAVIVRLDPRLLASGEKE